ncbi:MAG: tetratricopeptide repeat protein, partial [Bacteroidota bacterium]
RQAATAIVGGIGLIFAVLTVLRNPTWESNYRLFTTDIQHSPNSAKLRHAVAGVLTETYGNLPKAQQDQEKAMLAEALGHVNEALRLHPTYKQAYFTKGNLANYLRQFDVSINAYNNALRIDPDFEDAHRNLMITYRDAGRYYGEERGELAKAIGYLEQAYAALPNDAETVRLLGVAYGISGNNAKATELFTKRTQLEPNNARAWYDLGVAHSQAGRPEAADTAMAKARELDPEIAQKVRSGQ